MPPASTSTTSPTARRRAEAAPLEAVLFDLDGTLADTAADLTGALNGVLAEIGRPALELERTRPFASRGARALLRLGLGAQADDARVEALMPRFLELYGARLCEETCLYPGIDALIEELAVLNIRWGVVTNKPRPYTVPLVERLPLPSPPSAIVCGDDLAEKKPHPAPVRHALDEIGVPPWSALFAGDDRRDVMAGWRAGAATVVALWGYIDAGETPATWGADAVADDPWQLGRLIAATAG